MTAPNSHAREILERILAHQSLEDVSRALSPVSPDERPLPPRVPGMGHQDAEAVDRRRQLLRDQGFGLTAIEQAATGVDLASLGGNIEGCIGCAAVPLGIAGPLRINGIHARGDYYLPLATNEGALVASLQRGASVISLAGGATAVCLSERVSRAPCFLFGNLRETGQFLAWVLGAYDTFQEQVDTVSRHARLVDLRTSYGGKEVFLIFEYHTGDAAGQNMVTKATEAICRHILANSPVQPLHWYLEGNMSGDKKATMLAYTTVRGKKAVAECTIPAKLVSRTLHVEAPEIVRYWEVSVLGGVQSGSIGVQGHVANPLTALFIACGQDAACVAEAAIGTTRMDLTEAGDLYISVSLPNLTVGTVGGGTRLPTARECLAMLGCAGEGTARKFAEICAAASLAGELSIIGSLAAGDFAEAHAQYGRPNA